MIGMGVLDSVAPGFVSVSEHKWKNRETNNEPSSVLDAHRSPSPSTSTSTLSGNVSGELPPTIPPLSGEAQITGAGFLGPEVAGAEDWEALLSDSGHDQFLLRWISNELIQSDANGNGIEAVVALSSFVAPQQNPHPQNPNLGPHCSNFPVYPNETLDEKPQFLNQFPPNFQIPQNPFLSQTDPLKPPSFGSFTNSGDLLSQPQGLKRDKDTTFAQTLVVPQDPPSPLHQPPLKRPNLGNFGNNGNLGSFDLNPQLPELEKHPPQTLGLIPQQVVYDQLFTASELILAGNLSNAHLILARLNHQLTPGTLPFQRASFYLQEALLQLPLLGPGSGSPSLLSKSPTPVEGLFKIGAYKLLSEVSPLTHFVNFTSNQAILEAVGDSQRVHVIDFDIGSGAQWASLMAELPFGGSSKGTLYFKITAFTSPSTHHPFELGLMHENLTQFANEIGITFELEVVNLDAFDLNTYPIHLFKPLDQETTLAVNFPVWAFSNRLAMLPSLIRFVKQLSPKIVVTMERGCERFDLPVSRHLLLALQYYEAVLTSIDAANMNLETVSKIEKFIIQPKIENIVLGRISYPSQMPHWRALFAAAGFLQLNISDMAEIQADCVLKKTQVRGFHVEKRQTSLVLSWQGCELVSASAWKC